MTQRETSPPAMPASVRVHAFARLHMGFLDLNGGLGRQFGSLGLGLQAPVTRLRAAAAERCAASGPGAERAQALAERLHEHFGLPGGVSIELDSVITEHAGFGSGTQMSLAVGAAVARLHGLDVTPAEVARLLDRGARSGVGLGSFQRGGFIVDGGHRGDGTPPVISRLPFPEDWRLLLVLDRQRRGVHGDREKGAFGRLPEFPAELAGQLCRIVLMQVLPSLAEADVAGFGAGITDIQRRVGDHFAVAQGGRYASPEVAALLGWMEVNGAAGVGQSSWGPTGFAICESEAGAQALCSRARSAGLVGENVSLDVVAARNRGADIGLMARDDNHRPDDGRAPRDRAVEEGEVPR